MVFTPRVYASPRALWAMVLLLIGMTLFTFPHLDQSIWQDEWWSLYHSGSGIYGPLSLNEVWTRVITQDPLNAPGYYLLLNVWQPLIGNALFGLRYVSLLAGLLAVAMVFRISREMFNPRIALLAALIVGAQTTTLHYMHELRGYTLVLLMVTLVLWGYWRIITQEKISFLPQITLLIGMVGILYLHYLAALLLVAIALYHLLFVPKNRTWWRVPLLMALGALAFVPLLSPLLSVLTGLHETGWWLDTLSYSTPDLMALFFKRFSNNSAGLLLILLIAALVARWENRKAKQFTVFAFSLTAGLVLLANFALQFVIGIHYILFLLPLVALIAAHGMEAFARTLPRWVIVGVWIGLGIWGEFDPDRANWFLPDEPTLAYRELQRSLVPRVQAGDLVLLATPDSIYNADAYQGLLDYYVLPLGVKTALAVSGYATPDEFYYQSVENAVSGMERVWLTYDDTRRPWRVGPIEQEVLPQTGLLSCGTFTASAPVRLALWVSPPQSADVELGEISGSVVHVSETGDSLEVSMIWDAPNTPPDQYSFGVYLFDEAGNFVSQRDSALPVGTAGCVTLSLDIQGLAAGSYTLQTAVYDYRTQERLEDALLPVGDITLTRVSGS